MWVPVKRARASQLRGILVRLKAQRVHFLQASAWSAGDGEKVGEYVVRYADGQQRAIPLLYQRSRPRRGYSFRRRSRRILDWMRLTATSWPFCSTTT